MSDAITFCCYTWGAPHVDFVCGGLYILALVVEKIWFCVGAQTLEVGNIRSTAKPNQEKANKHVKQKQA